MSERLIKWEPLLNEKASDYTLTAIVERSCQEVDLRITLSHKNGIKKIDIYFKYATFANRMMPKTQDKETIHSLKEEWGSLFDNEYIFFKRADSPFLQWMSHQFYDAGTGKIVHFSFITSDTIIDVAAFDDPEITLINEP